VPAFFGTARSGSLTTQEMWTNTVATAASTGVSAAAFDTYGIHGRMTVGQSLPDNPSVAIICCFSSGVYYNQPMQVRQAIIDYVDAVAAALAPRAAAAIEPGRQRARNAQGQFRGDDPTTPDTNEAWR
jgi:hypothetical protein